MNATVEKTVTTVKNNWMGGAAVGVVAYLVAKKYGNVSNKWALAGLVVAGVLVGATIQAKVMAKKSAPTAATVKK